MSATEEAQERSQLMARLRGQTLLIVREASNAGGYLDIVARRLYGREQYHQCTLDELRDMDARICRRAQAEPIPGTTPGRLHGTPATARRMSEVESTRSPLLGVSARALGTCGSGQPISRPAPRPATATTDCRNHRATPDARHAVIHAPATNGPSGGAITQPGPRGRTGSIS